MERDFLLTMNIGQAQKAAIYLVLSDTIPASFIDLYAGNSGLTVVSSLLRDHGIKVRQVKIPATQNFLGRLAISKDETTAICMKEGIERQDWYYVCHLMGFPVSFSRSMEPFNEPLPEDFYPADMKDNALLRFPLTKGGHEEEVVFIRGLMEKMTSDFSELYEELHLPTLVH